MRLVDFPAINIHIRHLMHLQFRKARMISGAIIFPLFLRINLTRVYLMDTWSVVKAWIKHG
jgi:hypothetical protein